ncbi:MAG: hypothetical protein IKR04_01670 [Clostridia bacterium]|nr:hypothetical protein [Clostridia bacterium]
MNRYNVTAVLFIIIIAVVSIGSVSANAEYITDLSKEETINEVVSYVFGESNAFSKLFITIWSFVNSGNQNDISLIEDAEYVNLIKDENGFLYFPAYKVSVDEYANKTIDLSNMVDNFIYIQAPNKMIDGYTNKLVYNYNFSNENADEFLEKLNDAGVQTYDLRKDLLECGEEEDLFFKTDHHWKTNTAFWAYQKVVSTLNDRFNLDIDSDNYYRNLDNYNIKTYENCYLGSLGRRTGQAISGLDDYTYIEPKYSTNYTLYNMMSSDIEPIKNGSFANAIAVKQLLYDNNVETNKYATYFEWDYGYLRVINNALEDGKKVLLIKDSYALPFAAFLSTSVYEIDMIDLRDQPKADLERVIANNDYDVVIMLYNTESFTNQMFNF